MHNNVKHYTNYLQLHRIVSIIKHCYNGCTKTKYDLILDGSTHFTMCEQLKCNWSSGVKTSMAAQFQPAVCTLVHSVRMPDLIYPSSPSLLSGSAPKHHCSRNWEWVRGNTLNSPPTHSSAVVFLVRNKYRSLLQILL